VTEADPKFERLLAADVSEHPGEGSTDQVGGLTVEPSP
jgi:hypothetical protein